jgi:IclR family transcriptional regulator, acetate operon repressor
MSERGPEREGMRALDRVVAILEAVAESRGSMTPTVVAVRTGLSLSTVSRLMRQMADRGLLDRSPSDGTYTLGVRIIRMAQTTLEPDDFVEAALPEMRHLRDVTGETVSLFVRRRDMRICLAQIQSTRPVRRVVPVGFTADLHRGATGEVLMAGLSRAELERYLADLRLSANEIRLLRARLERIRDTGFAMAANAWIEDVSAIAAAVYDGDALIAAVSVAGPSYRFTTEVMQGFVEEVVRAAGRISNRISPMAAVVGNHLAADGHQESSRKG